MASSGCSIRRPLASTRVTSRTSPTSPRSRKRARTRPTPRPGMAGARASAGGRAPADQGLALESMVQAWSIGREIAWEEVAEAAERAGVDEDELDAATVIMTHFMEKLALMVTQGFLDHMKQAYEGEQHRMSVLVEIAKAMSRSLDLEEVVGVGLQQLRLALEVDWAGLWLVSVEKGL